MLWCDEEKWINWNPLEEVTRGVALAKEQKILNDARLALYISSTADSWQETEVFIYLNLDPKAFSVECRHYPNQICSIVLLFYFKHQ